MALAAGGVVTALNFMTIKDYFAGMDYEPGPEMAAIMDELGLSDKALMIFKASHPVLMERGDFNRQCREDETDTAILGCYDGETIYVYNIVNDEISGVRELATAHELLHAVYARMDAEQRTELGAALSEVYQTEPSDIGTELDLYAEPERMEELYVRVGTEIKDLPGVLERHYREIFDDQDKIVEYYNSYIAVFREVNAAVEALKTELTDVKATLDAEVAEYEQRARQLNADVVSFNACAKTPDCFDSDSVFATRRQWLVDEQVNLKEKYASINNLVEQYNALVTEYNANIIRGQTLNQAINSSVDLMDI